MPPVFNRYGSQRHLYQDALDIWLGATQPNNSGYRAMARNVQYDWRVSQAREKELTRVIPGACTGRSLQQAIVDYHLDRVQTGPSPDYSSSDLNGENSIAGVDKDVPLARVVDLNGLRPVFAWARDDWDSDLSETFAKFPRDLTEQRVGAWLDGKLEASTEGEKTEFVAAVLQAMNAYRRHTRYQPAWAAAWRAVEPHLGAGADRWVDVVGLYKPVRPVWVMVLRYKAGEAGMLIRPTQLDAGWYAHHFPSPPIAPLGDGGYAMDLGTAGRATRLVPEFIHDPIDHFPRHWQDAGRLLDRTSHAGAEDLPGQRESHYQLLCRFHMREVRAWMPQSL